ncbi:OmpH family outer membrane protein [Arundinibacter roseus]|uniref:OmpH family outer membrane protein n=1 Tax=Arundinibacter roseus TaxID=2070510 RepID=A0A4R4KAK2_9BACT|nr:OmpH family outer membrane protein [Arundinibacter roseus]TDB63411.1 OmpH family outer membrane protein [Arundinibacter roseus]
MKKNVFLVVLLSFFCLHAQAQKFGYVDMEYITSKMPEYQKAQSEMNQFSEKWAKEIQEKFAEIDRLQRAFMAEEVLLTDELKRKRQNELKEKELEAREYNNKVFGMDGMMFEKKKELMKPVLERVQRAVEKVCAQRRLEFLFDKSSDFVMVYTNPRHDYTDYILEELGIDTKPVPASAEATNQNSLTKKPK